MTAEKLELRGKHAVHFSSQTDEWRTPTAVYDGLNAEFDFDFDPCPLGGDVDGLSIEWGKRNFVNPPYSDISRWIAKGYAEWQAGKTVVFLIPSRTDTRWWHDYVMNATEIRFIKGRLRFGDAKAGAPFPSCVVVFDGE
jgi:phage N-6-adenine-methyltransferase